MDDSHRLEPITLVYHSGRISSHDPYEVFLIQASAWSTEARGLDSNLMSFSKECENAIRNRTKGKNWKKAKRARSTSGGRAERNTRTEEDIDLRQGLSQLSDMS